MSAGFDLVGARALVTGGTRGIGRAMAESLTRAGATVAVCARSQADVAEAEQTLGVLGFACDITDPVAVAELVRGLEARLGGLDVVVHNAGIQREVHLTGAVDAAAVELEIDLNLLAPMRLTAALMPLLRRSERAAVVNVTSILALAPKKVAPVYCATKAGLRSWTMAVRAQLAPEGIRVIELVPPLVKTAMTEGRDDGAVPPEVVAEALVHGLRRGRPVIRVGKAKVFAALHRLSPGFAEQMMMDR